MRIAWLTEHYPPSRGGMAVSCDRIVHGLRAHGVDIQVVILKGAGSAGMDMRRSPEVGGERLRVMLGHDLAHGLRALYACEFATPAAPIDAYVAFGGTLPVLAAPVFAAWSGRPLALLLRGNDFDTAMFQPARRSALADACTRAAAIVTVSRDMACKLAAWWPGLPVQVIANGLDPAHWQALPSDRHAAAALRQTLGLGAERCVFALAGELKAKKGLDVLAAALADTRLPARPAIVAAGALQAGDRPLLESIARHADFHHLPPRERHALIPVLLAADALLLPSLYDGLPNTLLEAAALARPVLGSACAGVAEVLADFPDCLARPGDAADLARMLARFMDLDAAARAELGHAQQTHVLQAYSAAAEAGAYLRLLQGLTGRT